MSNQQTMQWAKEETQGFNETKKNKVKLQEEWGCFIFVEKKASHKQPLHGAAINP